MMNYDEVKAELNQSALSLKHIHHSFFSPYMMYTLIIANNDFVLQSNVYLGNEQEVFLQSGDCWLMGGGIPELDELSKNAEASFSYLSFWPSKVLFLRSKAGVEKTFMPLLSSDQAQSLWAQVQALDANDLLLSHAWLQGRIQSLLSELCFYPWQSKTFQKDVFDDTFSFVHWRLRHVQRQISEQDIKAITPLTYQQINNRMRQVFGSSLHQITLFNRVATAERIVGRCKKMKMGEIAKKSGFTSLDSMNQSFKKIRGYRLSEFKKSLEDKLALKKLLLGENEVLKALALAEFDKIRMKKALPQGDKIIVKIINVSESRATVYLCLVKGFQEVVPVGAKKLACLPFCMWDLLKITQGDKEWYYQITGENHSVIIE